MVEITVKGRQRGETHTAMIDDADEWLAGYTWRIANNGYAVRAEKRKGKTRRYLLHREVLGLDRDDPNVDHINGEKLDCRRSNLRLCPDGQVQNLQNARKKQAEKGKPCSSRFKGVSWDSRNGSWKAYITVDGVTRHIGCFKHEVDAARAYNREAKRHFGEWARVNGVPA